MKGVLGTLVVLLVVGSLLLPAAGGVGQAQFTSPFGSAVGAPVSADSGPMGGHHVFIASLSKSLGLSPEQLVAAVMDGKSLRDLAKVQGMDDKALAGALRSAAQDSLNDKVSNSRMTEDEASTYMAALNDISDTDLVNVSEAMLARMRTHMQNYGNKGGRQGQGMP